MIQTKFAEKKMVFFYNFFLNILSAGSTAPISYSHSGFSIEKFVVSKYDVFANELWKKTSKLKHSDKNLWLIKKLKKKYKLL